MSNGATVLYPNNTSKVPLNIKDSIVVSYTSQWQSLNITLLCRAATSNIFAYHNVPGNPVVATGTYLTESIEAMKFGIQQYPADCMFRLTEYGNNDNHIDGAAFSLTSSEASPKTFGISTTAGLSTSTSTDTSSTQTSTDPSATRATTSATSPAAAGASTTTESLPQQTNIQTASSSNSSGLTTAASAGLGVGITLAVIILISGIVGWIILRRRKKRNQMSNRGGDYQQAQPHEYNESPVYNNSGYSTEKDRYFDKPAAAEKDGANVIEMPAPARTDGHPTRYEFNGPGQTRFELGG